MMKLLRYRSDCKLIRLVILASATLGVWMLCAPSVLDMVGGALTGARYMQGDYSAWHFYEFLFLGVCVSLSLLDIIRRDTLGIPILLVIIAAIAFEEYFGVEIP